MTHQQSDSINELATALAKAQGQIKPAAKDSTNPHFKSKYADLASVWEACRKPLADNGLSVVQLPVEAAGSQMALTTMLLHSSGQYISATYSVPVAQATAQGAGSALTYLRRYALAAMVGVVADEDDDGDAASNGQQRQQQTQRPAQQQTRPAPQPTMTAKEAEKRFYTTWGEVIGGHNWAAVQSYLAIDSGIPTDVETWTSIAYRVRAKARGDMNGTPETKENAHAA